MTNDDKMTKCASAFDTGCVGRVKEDGQTDNDKKKKEAQKRMVCTKCLMKGISRMRSFKNDDIED